MIITIETGLKLVRYDLSEQLPDKWDAKKQSNYTEYSNLEYGNKNKEGFYFFFDNMQTCQAVAKEACKNEKKKSILADQYENQRRN